MAATLTTVSGPNNIAPNLKIAVYTVAFDTSYPTGGEPIDLSGDFDFVYAIACGSNDTSADNGYLWRALHPGATTAVSSTNCTIQAFWSPDGTSGEVFTEFTNTGDLSSVGELAVVVFGA